MCAVCDEGARLQHEALGIRELTFSEAEHDYLMMKTNWPVLHSPLFIGAQSIYAEYDSCPHAWTEEGWKKFADTHLDDNGKASWLRCKECTDSAEAAFAPSI